ncbi:hypothetical protein ACI2KS_24135 [Pseudomonas sp. NPDC087358]|uniref:hypothetical protein n=1 Tax=Pseudomonas sp. NPDC087358 TaxID=3364439 RepID=UPI00384D5493
MTVESHADRGWQILRDRPLFTTRSAAFFMRDLTAADVGFVCADVKRGGVSRKTGENSVHLRRF